MLTEPVFLKPLAGPMAASPLLRKKGNSQRASLLRSTNQASAAQHKQEEASLEGVDNPALQARLGLEPLLKPIELERYGKLVSRSLDHNSSGQFSQSRSQEGRSRVPSIQVVVDSLLTKECG